MSFSELWIKYDNGAEIDLRLTPLLLVNAPIPMVKSNLSIIVISNSLFLQVPSVACQLLTMQLAVLPLDISSFETAFYSFYCVYTEGVRLQLRCRFQRKHEIMVSNGILWVGS